MVLTSAVGALAWPAAAAASPAAGPTQTTAAPTTAQTTTTTTAPAPTPKPKPRPKHGYLKLYLRDGFTVFGQPVTVTKRPLNLDGVVRPYVSGQTVIVAVYFGHRLIKRQRLRIKPSRRRTYGHFTERITSSSVGNVTAVVWHAHTDTLTAFSAAKRYAALDSNIGFGATGRMVVLLQQRLAALHFYIPQTGVYDNGTGLAIDAYHRLLHWGVSQQANRSTIVWLLNGWGEFKVRYPRHGRHAEGNLGSQLLALIDGSRVDYIFPISSGKPSTPTVLGNFHVYRRDPGYLPDGMYFSSFFIGGYAIHGYDPAPDYPASHGCMRLPIPDAITAFNWLNFGDAVDVYY
jgi:L,D-transpeptidase catalytic domain